MGSQDWTSSNDLSRTPVRTPAILHSEDRAAQALLGKGGSKRVES